MKKAILLILLILGSLPLYAFSFSDWQTIETGNFIIYYPAGYDFRAKQALYYLTTNEPMVKKMTGNENRLKTAIVIQDYGMYVNGSASIYGTKIVDYTCDPNSDAFAHDQDYTKGLYVHEYTHINQLHNTSGLANIATFFLGDLYAPNICVPMWVLEGITVYTESQLNKYSGRLNYGEYDALIQSKAKADKLPNSLQANYMYATFPLGQHYLYGGSFFRYLSATYGEDKFAKFFYAYSSHFLTPQIGIFFPSIGIDSVATEIYGKGFDKLFLDWQEAEKKQAADWEIVGDRISIIKTSSVFKKLAAINNKLYYEKQNFITPGPFAFFTSYCQLAEYDPITSKERLLFTFTNVSDYSSIQADTQNTANLYFVGTEFEPCSANIDNYGIGLQNVLYRINVNNLSKPEEVFFDEFYDYVPLASGTIFYSKRKKTNFGSELWFYEQGKKYKVGETEELISEIKSYKDKLLVVYKKSIGSWNIGYLNMKTLQITPIINTYWHETNIKIVGDTLIFTANYDKKIMTYAYGLKTGSIVRISTGSYAKDGVIVSDKLFFVGLEADGEGLYQNSISAQPYILPPQEEITESIDLHLSAATINTLLSEGASSFPYNRIFPELAAGSDHLSLFDYQLSFSSSGQGISAFLNTKLFIPLRGSVATNLLSNNPNTVINFSYPLLQRLSNGISNIFVGLSIPSNKTMDLTGFVNYSFPENAYTLSASLNKPARLDTSAYLSVVNTLYSTFGKVSLKGSVYKDYPVSENVRGFSDYSSSAGGSHVTLELTRQFLQVRDGFWNPNIFIGDVYGVLFADYSTINGGRTSYGAELQTECSSGYFFSIVPVFGIATSEGSLSFLYFSLKLNGF